MEELRKEFESILELTQHNFDNTAEFRLSLIADICSNILEQKLSEKQVGEEEFKKFVMNIEWSSDFELDYKDYLISRIFSHYTLIPKETK